MIKRFKQFYTLYYYYLYNKNIHSLDKLSFLVHSGCIWHRKTEKNSPKTSKTRISLCLTIHLAQINIYIHLRTIIVSLRTCQIPNNALHTETSRNLKLHNGNEKSHYSEFHTSKRENSPITELDQGLESFFIDIYVINTPFLSVIHTKLTSKRITVKIFISRLIY